MTLNRTEGAGKRLMERLGIESKGIEGHDHKIACPFCPSGDAARIHQDTGIGQCYACHEKWSAFALAKKFKGHDGGIQAMIDVGLFAPRNGSNGNGHHANGNGQKVDPIEAVARAKRITPEALRRYGTKVVSGKATAPQYGPDGQQCSSCTLPPDGKGLNEKGKPTGLYFPHDDAGQVCLPRAGEKWHIVEGVKDACALSDLGLKAVGLPTSTMAAKFGRLFAGVEVVVIPDRDKAGTDGAGKTARVLQRVAESIAIATLPAEYQESKGADTRDILAMPNGRELLLQAIADARLWGGKGKAITGNRAAPSIMSEDWRTDVGNGRRLVSHHGQDFRFCHVWGKALCYDGKRWAIDDTNAIGRMAKDVSDAIWRDIGEAIPDADRETVKALLAFGKATASTRGIQAMIAQASSEPGIPVLPDQLDADPWLLNVLNGTIDLRTGELRPHSRKDMLTKLAPVTFDPAAECPRWLKFNRRIFEDNRDLIAFVRRVVGMSLTGLVRDHLLMFLYGTGQNGKSVFLTTMLALLGDYGLKANSGLLLAKKGESHPTEQARLAGKRFCACIEADEGKRLAESLVKELSGGDKIAARRMREDFWEFSPQHKLWLAANHKPSIKGTDFGIWRRIKLVPFTVTIPPEERDGELPEKLQAELPGILNWALLGLVDYLAQGMAEPDIVLAETNKYRSEMDVLGLFLSECCIQSPGYQAKASTLYGAYRDWAENAGEHAVSGRRFGLSMLERGFQRVMNNGTWYRGLTLTTEGTEG